MTTFGGSRGEIVLSRSDDLRSWSTPEQVLQPRHGALVGLAPDRDRPAAASHRARLAGDLPRGQGDRRGQPSTASASRSTALDDPARVLAPRVGVGASPTAPYEREGDIPNTVFPCGLVHDADSGEVRLYYGAADTTICLATAQLDDLLDAVRS